LLSRLKVLWHVPNRKRSDTIPEGLLLHGTNNFPLHRKVALRITNKQIRGKRYLMSAGMMRQKDSTLGTIGDRIFQVHIEKIQAHFLGNPFIKA
jgi:hypothetical protein